MTPRRIYISGPITGYPDGNAKSFSDMAKLITDAGHVAVNPHELPHDHGKTWREYMDEDIKAMMTCDLVVTLPGWNLSKGAMIEVGLAYGLGITAMEWYEAQAILRGL